MKKEMQFEHSQLVCLFFFFLTQERRSRASGVEGPTLRHTTRTKQKKDQKDLFCLFPFNGGGGGGGGGHTHLT